MNSFLQAHISLADFLIMTGMGQGDSLSGSIPAMTVFDQTGAGALAPHSGDQAILVDEIQFDGVLSGQVVYDFWAKDGSEFPAYAVQAVPYELNILNPGAMKYQISNQSAQVVVFNIKYVSISADAYRNLQTALKQFGGDFGLAPRSTMQ